MRDRKIIMAENIVGNVLRLGLILSLLITMLGGTFFLWKHGHQIYNYHVFSGEPYFLRKAPPILFGAIHDDASAIIQLGILLLIATPVFRVLSCIIIYACQRDYMYVIISAIVLSILVFSLFL